MNINEFVLENEDKVERALHGSIGAKGQLIGGVGDNASPEVLLAEYDRLGGYITKDGVKVKNGSFWDFDKKIVREVPQVSFLTTLDGEIIEVDEEEAKSLKKAEEKKNALKALKGKKVKKGKIKTKNEDYEE